MGATLALILAMPAMAWPELLIDGETVPFTVHEFTTREGLPQNSVLSLAQTPEGRLWIATTGGLAHFNGQAFGIDDVSTIDELETSRFAQVAADSEGNVIAACSFGSVFQNTADIWKRLTMDHACEHATRAIQFAPSGTAWMAKLCGLYRLAAGADRFELVRQGNFRSLSVDAAGTAWASSNKSVVAYSDQAEPEPLQELAGGLFSAVAVTTTDRVFALIGDDVSEWRDGQWERLDLGDALINRIQAGADGRLWILGDRALLSFDTSSDTLHNPELLGALDPQAGVACLIEGQGDSVWIGTQTRGLFHFVPSPLRGFHHTANTGRGVRSVAMDNQGTIYASALDLWRIEGRDLVLLEGLRANRIASSATGGIWVAQTGLIGRLEGGVVEPYWATQASDPDALLTTEWGALLESQSGALWVARDQALYRCVGDDVHLAFRLNDSELGATKSLLETQSGDVWVGYEAGLAHWDGQTVRLYGRDEGLAPGEVRSIAEAPDGAIWIGTYGGGLGRFVDGRLQFLDRSRGLHESTAIAIVFDPTGRLVVIGNRAVTSYSIDELQAVLKDPELHAHGRVYDRGQNLDLLEGNGIDQPRALLDSSGSIWFPALRGIARYDERYLSDLNPQIRVEVHVNPGPNAIQSDRNTFSLAPSDRNVEINYSAVSFRTPPQLHYRYRLVPHESKWQERDAPGLASYSKLPPGNYVFEIQAALADGAYGPANTSMQIRVPAMFTEQPAIRLVFVGCLIALGFGLLYLRGRATRHRASQLEQVVQRRTHELSEEVLVRKQVEQELRESGERLEGMVSDRTAELARALTNLEWDMQRRENIEKRLRESEKLEAVGRLAGGIAHDFNNILTAVMGESDLAELEIEMHQDLNGIRGSLIKHLTNVRDAGTRAARLTKQLLAYSRQQVLQPKRINPLDVMRELLTMLERLVPKECQIQLDPESTCYPIMIDPGQLEQVIVNLVVNASEAMPSGGTIRLSSKQGADSAGMLKTTLQVVDNGKGLSSEELARIFEPFFSTKGQARGLGLASVQGIIVQSGGTLHVESELNVGTTFTIHLPAMLHDESSVPTSTFSPPSQTRGLKILLIDDEDDVRRVAREMLEHLGHTVLDAHNRKSALRLANRHHSELDLLISDIVMPETNGIDLAQEILEVCPEIKTLFITGYSGDRLDTMKALGAHSVLTKPFDSKLLNERIQNIMQTQVAPDLQ